MWCVVRREKDHRVLGYLLWRDPAPVEYVDFCLAPPFDPFDPTPPYGYNSLETVRFTRPAHEDNVLLFDGDPKVLSSIRGFSKTLPDDAAVQFEKANRLCGVIR